MPCTGSAAGSGGKQQWPRAKPVSRGRVGRATRPWHQRPGKTQRRPAGSVNDLEDTAVDLVIAMTHTAREDVRVELRIL